MQIELVGCTGAGKSTLAWSVLQSCGQRGISLVTSEEFVLRRARLHWVPGRVVRTVVLDLCALYACLATWRKNRALYGFAVRTIFRSPAAWRHKVNLLRNVLKKIGIYEIIRRGSSDDQLILVDEGTVHAAHNLFVHGRGQPDAADLSTFVGLLPLPDVVVLVEQSESVLVDRTVARGHKRIPKRSRAAVQAFVQCAVEVFRQLARQSPIAERLLVVDGRGDTVAGLHAAPRPRVIVAREILGAAADGMRQSAEANSPVGQEADMSLHHPVLNARQSRTTAGLREHLRETLESQGVACCLWKGSCGLDHDTAEEDKELHLLVARDDAQRFESVLASLGFKRALDAPGASLPSLLRFFGWDAGADAFLRLQVYYRLIAGESPLDGYSFPLERLPWHRCRLADGQAVPDAFAELRRQLRPYRRQTAFTAASPRPVRGLRRAWCRLCGRKGQERLASGGAVIAVVGADATGKSTLLFHCGRWLGKVFDIKMVHAGKPPATWLSAPFTAVLRLIRRVARRPPIARPEGQLAAGDTGQPAAKSRWASLAYAIRAVVLAWERRQLLVRARHRAANGQLVLCDRYPSDTLGAMDSPRLRVDPGRSGVVAKACNWLAGIEARLYQEIPPPDVVLRLAVSVETAKQRNRNRAEAQREDEAYVECRHRQNVAWQKSGTRYVYDIVADGTLADTLRMAKEAIWQSI